MRIQPIALSAFLGLGLLASCTYDFDPEGDMFECEDDEDCISGWKCGGHTLMDGDLLSYCIDPEDEDENKLSIYLTASLTMTNNSRNTVSECALDNASNNAGQLPALKLLVSKFVGVTASHTFTETAPEWDSICQEPLLIGPGTKQGLVQVLCKTTLPSFDNTDKLHAHVWLGVHGANETPDASYTDWWALIWEDVALDKGDHVRKVPARPNMTPGACERAKIHRTCWPADASIVVTSMDCYGCQGYFKTTTGTHGPGPVESAGEPVCPYGFTCTVAGNDCAATETVLSAN